MSRARSAGVWGIPERALPWLSVAGALVLFDLLPRIGVLPRNHFPPMSERWSSPMQLAAGSSGIVLSTVQGWALGLGIATALAIPLGIVIGSSHLLYRASRGLIEFLRPIPSVALIPLAILAFWDGHAEQGLPRARLGTSSGCCWWPPSTACRTWTRWPPTPRARSAFWRAQRLFRVTLPSAVPYIATGLRIASAVALILSVTAELVIGARRPRAIDQPRALGWQRGADVRAHPRDRRARPRPQPGVRPGRAPGPALAPLAARGQGGR